MKIYIGLLANLFYFFPSSRKESLCVSLCYLGKKFPSISSIFQNLFPSFTANKNACNECREFSLIKNQFGSFEVLLAKNGGERCSKARGESGGKKKKERDKIFCRGHGEKNIKSSFKVLHFDFLHTILIVRGLLLFIITSGLHLLFH